MTLRNISWHYSPLFGFILHYSWQFFTKHKNQNWHSIPWSKKYYIYAIYEEIRPVQLNWNVRKIIQTDSSFQGLGQYEKSERKKKSLYTIAKLLIVCNNKPRRTSANGKSVQKPTSAMMRRGGGQRYYRGTQGRQKAKTSGFN